MNNRFLTFFLGVFTVVVLIELMFIKRQGDSDGFYDLFASFNQIKTEMY